MTACPALPTSSTPHTLQRALPTRRRPILAGRRSLRCLAPSWPLGSRHTSGYSTLSLLLDALLATWVSFFFRCRLGHSAPLGLLVPSWLFSALPGVRRPPSHSTFSSLFNALLAIYTLLATLYSVPILGAILGAQHTPCSSMSWPLKMFLADSDP